MARPKPTQENLKVRSTVSLTLTVRTAADIYRENHPEEYLDDFSALVSRSLVEYIEKRHQGLIAAVAKELRSGYVQEETLALRVAENASARIAPRKKAYSFPTTPAAAKFLAKAAGETLRLEVMAKSRSTIPAQNK
jgi:hypothetical protein